MKSKSILLAVSITCISCTASIAAPESNLQQVEAVLTAPCAELPTRDRLLQRAIDFIKHKKAQPNEPEKMPIRHEHPFGQRQIQSDRVMILGGPEIVPM